MYPRLFKGTHVTHPAYEHHRVRRVSLAAAGIVGYADGERLCRVAAHRRRGTGSPDRLRAMSMLAEFAGLYDFKLDDFQRRACAALEDGHGVLVAAPDRLGQDAGRRVRRAPGAGTGRQVLLHDADQGAVEPEVRRPDHAVRTRAGRPAHR